MKEYLKVGSYTPETEDAPEVIQRGPYGEGMVFKDEEAFLHHADKPCYVPELDDVVYTRRSFLELCGGREDFARECFDTVDWQHPEPWVEEQFSHGEWAQCPACDRWYNRYGERLPCDYCGGPLEYAEGPRFVKKYLVIDVFERDIALPQVFGTAGAALGAMVEAVAEVLEMEPGVILRALHESESYIVEDKCEVYKTSAWANAAQGRLDVVIVELNPDTGRCAF